MPDKILAINTFSGGLSSGSKIGLRGSFRWGQGLNIHNDPDRLQINPASTKDSGSTVVGLIRFSTTNTVNDNLYFGDDSGNVYKRTSAGVWSVLDTLASGITGMNFFSGTNLIYLTSGNQQYTLDPSTDTITSYRALASADYHQSEPFLDKIFTGSGREIVSTDASAIDYDSTTVGGGITIDYNYKAKCIKNLGNWLFIGASSDNSGDARYFLWDGFSADYNYARTLRGEDGINAVEVADDGTVLIFAGKQGSIYQLTGIDSPLVRIETLPRIELDKTIEIYPQATANYRGNLVFGLSNGTSVTAERGVYSWTSNGKDYNKVLNFEYATSTTTTTGTILQIGNLLCPNTTDLFFSWRDSTSYGVDKVNGTGVQASGLWESLIHDAQEPLKTKYYKNIQIKLAGDLATTQIINLYYKADRASTWTKIVNGTDTNSIDYSVDGAINYKSFKPNFRAKEAEFKLSFNHTSTTAPSVDSVVIIFTDEEYE